MTLESSNRKNLAVSFLVLSLGIMFLYLTSKNQPWVYDLNYTINRNQQSANLLGYLLVSIGIFSLITFKKIKITIDATQKKIFTTSSSFFSKPLKQTISFQNITKIETVRVGRSRHPFYMLVFIFNNRAPLRTNYWSQNEYEIKNLGQQIADIIGCTSSDTPSPLSQQDTFESALIALVLAMTTWALFYKIKFGDVCVAMWFGTAPALVIFSSFIAYYRLIKKLKAQKN